MAALDPSPCSGERALGISINHPRTARHATTAIAAIPSNPSGAQRLATSPIKSVTPTNATEPPSDFVPRHTAHRGPPILSPTVAAAGSASPKVIAPSAYAAGY